MDIRKLTKISKTLPEIPGNNQTNPSTILLMPDRKIRLSVNLSISLLKPHRNAQLWALCQLQLVSLVVGLVFLVFEPGALVEGTIVQDCVQTPEARLVECRVSFVLSRFVIECPLYYFIKNCFYSAEEKKGNTHRVFRAQESTPRPEYQKPAAHSSPTQRAEGRRYS